MFSLGGAKGWDWLELWETDKSEDASLSWVRPNPCSHTRICTNDVPVDDDRSKHGPSV